MRFQRISTAIAVVAAVAACSDSAVPPTQVVPDTPLLARQGEAPLQQMARGKIPDEYIVVLNDNEDVNAVVASVAVTPQYTYHHTIRGFAATLTNSQLARLRRDARVKYISENGIVTADQDRPGRTGLTSAPPSIAISQPTPAGLWGLDRSDQPTTVNGSYVYTNRGTGVKVYILDTGGNFLHNDFDGAALNRYKKGIDIVTPNGTANDCNGHGTHVAGTIGGTTYGVAKAVTMYAVRVLDCGGSGSWAGFIAGADWVTFNHVKPAVANASLGGGFIQAANDAVTKSILYGVTWVLSAGNSGADACGASPASTPLAMTVMASDIGDNRASFSNFGPCADIYAPGVNVQSAWIGSATATVTISGTSMAAPHVAGQAALFLQAKSNATPQEVIDVLKLNGASNQIIGNPGGTVNLIATKQTGSCSAVGVDCAGIEGNSQFPHTGSSWFYFSGTGAQRGYLRGTPGTDFDLSLYEWTGAAWLLRVNSNTTTTNPVISFNSTCAFGAGNCYKMFKVISKLGVGSFDFWYNRQ